MRLYLDEDIASRELTSRLATAGHDVLSPLRGESDSRCWQYAQEHGATVVTMNVVDFARLAEATQGHAGLLLVYRENDPTRDMKAAAVVGGQRIDRGRMCSYAETRVPELDHSPHP